MTDLLQSGSEWLENRRTEHMARPVTYLRGAQTLEGVPATVGKTVFRLDTGYGQSERSEARDYLILASHLTLGVGDAPALPEPGDQIVEVAEGVAYTYEVMAPGGEPAWRWSDPFFLTLRIHTKLVKTEPA